MCYGLYKIHKNIDVPRSVVSCIDTSTSFLQEYVKNVSTKALQSPYSNVRDSWTFKNKINNTVIPPGHYMISLDVTSLFTNITTEAVIKSLKK